MNIRNFKSSDYPLIKSWFKDGPELEQMPEESSFVLEVENKPQACVSVFLTNTNIAYFENLIANPKFKKSERKEAIQKLMEHAWSFAKDKGYKYAVGFTLYEKLAARHLEMGWNKKFYSILVGKEL